MKKTAEKFWELIQSQCKDNELVKFDLNSKQRYANACEKEYKSFKSKHMKAKVDHLDRHKVGAILIAEGLECHIITLADKKIEKKCKDNNELFIGEEKILISCGLYYIIQQINMVLDTAEARRNEIKPMLEFKLPEALSCQTHWIDIMSRTMYYNKEDNKISQLSIAEELFLLEQLAIRDYYDDSGKVLQYLKDATCKKLSS